MFQSQELDDHLKTSDTIELETKVYVEWNMNDPDNIEKLGNYRYRPTDIASNYNKLTNIYDPNDSANWYTGATDADTVIESGLNEEDEPTIFLEPKKKMKLLYSLEDCVKPFRPRSGINKLIYFGNDGTVPASAQYIDDSRPDIARRPRYYMGSRDDQFKYWTSYRTEYGRVTSTTVLSYNVTNIEAVDGVGKITTSISHSINPKDNIYVNGINQTFDGIHTVLSTTSNEIYYSIPTLSPVASASVTATVSLLNPNTQVARGFSFYNSSSSVNYIEDACPFVVYSTPVPANKVVVKMQTNIGDSSHGNVKNERGSCPDPLYGNVNKTTPVEWKIQALKGASWEDLVSFNSTSTKTDGSPLIGPDGYVEISYGLVIPDQYKDIFIFAEEISSVELLPDTAAEGYAYLVRANKQDLGIFHIYTNMTWQQFLPAYNWHISSEQINRNSNVVTSLVDPDYYLNINDKKIYREFEFVSGLRIVVKTMNKANCTFDLIEFSPRLFADITESVSDYSISKVMSDLGNGSLPVGGIYATTGSMTIFDDNFSFNENNPFDPATGKGSIVSGYVTTNSTTGQKTSSKNYLSNMIKFVFYEIIKNVDNYDYFIPVKSMYANGFPQTVSAASLLQLQLRDFFFFLEASPAPQLFLTDVSISYAVTLLLDYIGFDNYVFRRVKKTPELIIPYFFVEPGKNCAEVLMELAVASQTAMFFDEYNNFVVMSKEYILPNSEQDRSSDSALYGQVQALKADGKEVTILGYLMSEDELPLNDNLNATGFIIGNSIGEQIFEWVDNGGGSAEWVNQGYAEKVYAPNITNISTKEKRVYNDGQINYTVRYLQRSLGTLDATLKSDQYHDYIYKPSLLWEVQGKQQTKTKNDQTAQQGGYVLSAVPLNSDLTEELPYATNGRIYKNVIDVGENVYWMSSFQGYLYSAGEIIKFDAIEYSVNVPIWYPVDASGSIDYYHPIVVPSGLFAPIGTEDVTKWRSEHTLGSSNIWVTSNHQYQDLFGNLPFNGKLYPTGRIRIYTDPEYESVGGILRIKNAFPIKKHGRGQFGTQVTSHSAGINSYWLYNPDGTSNINVRGCFQESGPYLFTTNQYINYPANITQSTSGKQKRVLIKSQDGTDKPIVYNADDFAQESVRTGSIKTFLTDKNPTEKTFDYIKTTSPRSVQSSALCFSGPRMTDPIKDVNFVSYIIKEFKDENNAYIPFKHYGTRMRIIGKIGTSKNDSLIPIGGYSIYNGDTVDTGTTAITNSSTSTTTPDLNPGVTGGSGGIAFNINASANTGYFFEIVALSVKNISDYQNISTSNIVSANILSDPAPTCTNNEVTIYTKDSVDWQVGQKVVISGLVDTNQPTNTLTPLNGEYTITAAYSDGKRFKYKINPPSPLTTTSKTGGVAMVDISSDVNIANVFFYKVLSSDKGNGITSYQRQTTGSGATLKTELTVTLKNVNTFAVGDYIKISNVSASINGEYSIKSISNQSLIMNATGTNIALTNRTVAASVTTDIALVYPTAIPFKLWSGLTEILTDTGEGYGQGRFMGEKHPTVYDLAAEYVPIGTSRRFFLYLNGKQIAVVDDTSPLAERNNLAPFVRGQSRCMFENVYALGNNYSQSTNFPVQQGVSQVFGDSQIDATEAFNKYAMSGLVQNTYLSGISSFEDPKYRIYFDEFGTIMREAAYFNIKYDRAYPALSAQIAPSFNNMRGYTISGFYAWSYGADFLIFNATDLTVKLDDTAAGFLRINGVAFTQNTTYTLTVDDLYKKRSNLLDTAIGKDVTLYNPLRVNEEYNELKNSRIKYGKNEFTVESMYIQSTDAAENVFGWIVKKISKPRKMIGVNTFATSNLQLGDILKVNYISNDGINVITDPNKRFVVYQIDYSKGANGYNNTMYLAEV